MNAVKLCYLMMLGALLAGCSFNCSVGESKPLKSKTITSADNMPLNGAVIKNDIELEATAVKVSQVYLLDANKNLMEDNVTAVGKKIYVIIKTDTGWIKENGKSFIGASERISTSAGKVLVDAADIFIDHEATGMPADDAGVISLSAVITQADPGVENFTVQFRVWDKKGEGEIKGKYKFRIRK
ncbi:MAG TPA: hypothetical protein VK489_04915 [Ferruginibacter sp.]|nr:hypothetical protein [Ferruginibacter sp.]